MSQWKTGISTEVQTQKLSREGIGYFLEQHITILCWSSCVLKQKMLRFLLTAIWHPPPHFFLGHLVGVGGVKLVCTRFRPLHTLIMATYIFRLQKPQREHYNRRIVLKQTRNIIFTNNTTVSSRLGTTHSISKQFMNYVYWYYAVSLQTSVSCPHNIPPSTTQKQGKCE